MKYRVEYWRYGARATWEAATLEAAVAFAAANEESREIAAERIVDETGAVHLDRAALDVAIAAWTELPMDRPDYVKCVRRTAAGFEHKAWCGRDIWSHEFSFENVDHAAENGMAGGRLVTCPACRKAIAAALGEAE
jgi:hypothetical protein